MNGSECKLEVNFEQLNNCCFHHFVPKYLRSFVLNQ